MARIIQFPAPATVVSTASIMGAYNDRWLTDIETINHNTFASIPAHLHASSSDPLRLAQLTAILEADLGDFPDLESRPF